MKRWMVWMLVLALALVTRAEAGEPVEELELEMLLELQVVAATKQATPLERSPVVGNVVSRSQVDDYGWSSLNELIATQPGFFPSRDYERRTIGARGEHEAWNNNRLLLLIDGLPQNDVETGTAFTWEITPLFLARSVEVLRGPGSSLYGSYALHGVVSMDTVSASDLGDRDVVARVRASAGTQVLDVLGAVTSTFADAVIAFNRHQTEGEQEIGVDDSGRLDENGERARFAIDDERSSSTFFFKAQAHGALEGLTLTLQLQSWEFATGRGWLYFTPDHENMNEQRQTASLRYQTPGERTWTQEYALLFQRHGYREDVRHYPDGALDGFYPRGVTETIETAMSSVFARAQLGRALPRGGKVLAGVEYTGLLHGGDERHTVDADILGEGDPLDSHMALPPLYEPMVDHLVSKVGVYAQATSGEMFLGGKLELVAGLRYDNLFFDYTAHLEEGRPTRSRSFQDMSPRLALILHPIEPLHVKLMAARAFRTPTPVELFVANTWSAAMTDIQSLEAERQDTYEVAADWRVAGPLRLRANGWLSSLQNQIGYHQVESLIVNRFDDWRAGVESELLFDARLGRTKIDGWLSWSFATLLSETVLEPGLAETDRIVGAPAHQGKLGVRVRHGRVTATAQGLFHGEVHRRATDRADEENRTMRPDVLPAWVTLDASLHVRALDWARVGVSAKNLTGSTGGLAAQGDVPFDYLVDGRRVLFELSLDL